MTQDPIMALQGVAQRHWDKTDRVMAALSRGHPLQPTQFWNPDPFQALVEAIVFQQVSLAAGASIHAKLEAAVGDIRPAAFDGRSVEELRGAGLSRAKASYVLDLADHFAKGRLGPHLWTDASDEEVIQALCDVRGIGPWTAKMFLMFHLQRPDVCAPEDLGLRQAYALVYGGDEKDAWKAMERRRSDWSPYATVACRVLWKARRDED